MQRLNTLIFLLIVVAIIATLHLAGFEFQFYWRLYWYDRIVHTLSGFWVTFVTLQFTKKYTQADTFKIASVGLAAILIIGILWEFFEYGIGATSLSDLHFVSNSIGDLICDIAGGIIAIVMSIIIFRREQLWNNKKLS
ncbi:MAG: hypothetical protein V4519_00800 [Patescibacteria group bacterium]